MNVRRARSIVGVACGVMALAWLGIRGAEDDSEKLNALLKKTVSFEFKETPLDEAVKYISSQAGVSIALDASVKDTAAAQLNLRVKDMEVGKALEMVARLVELEVVRSKGGIVLRRPLGNKN